MVTYITKVMDGGSAYAAVQVYSDPLLALPMIRV
jgi:hypothetical protein